VAQDLNVYATRLSGKLVGSLRVGLYAPEGFPEIAEIVKSLRSHHPGLELQFIERISAEVLKEIIDGGLDAGFFLGPASSPSISSHVLRTVPLAVVAPEAWQRRVAGATWETLSRFPWIDCPGYCPFQAAVEEIFRSKSLFYERVVHADGGRTRLKLVAAGLGLALVTMSRAQAAIASERVIIVPTEPIPCKFSFGYLSSKTNDPLIAVLRSGILDGIRSQKRQATAQPR